MKGVRIVDIPKGFCPVHLFEKEPKPCNQWCLWQRHEVAVLQIDYQRYWLRVFGKAAA
jgi:hypothetical protein